MRRRGRAEVDGSVGRDDHDVSNLGGRRLRGGPGKTSMMVIGPPQQGHGIAVSVVSAAEASSVVNLKVSARSLSTLLDLGR